MYRHERVYMYTVVVLPVLVPCAQTGKTFLTVERKDSMGAWHVVHTDASWETK